MICVDCGPGRSSGRPVVIVCPRGHQRAPRTKCVECRRLKDRAWYDRNKEAKKASVQQWRGAFLAEFQMTYSKAYAAGLRKGTMP